MAVIIKNLYVGIQVNRFKMILSGIFNKNA